jgi:hypothetical protein
MSLYSLKYVRLRPQNYFRIQSPVTCKRLWLCVEAHLILGVIRHFLKRNNVRIKHLEQSKTWIKTRLWPSIIVFDISIIHLFRQLQHNNKNHYDLK